MEIRHFYHVKSVIDLKKYQLGIKTDFGPNLTPLEAWIFHENMRVHQFSAGGTFNHLWKGRNELERIFRRFLSDRCGIYSKNDFFAWF